MNETACAKNTSTKADDIINNLTDLLQRIDSSKHFMENKMNMLLGDYPRDDSDPESKEPNSNNFITTIELLISKSHNSMSKLETEARRLDELL